MDEVWTLVLLSLAMLIGCYLAGSVPLAVTLSEDKLKLVTVLGAGLLVGTALAVIIPEGIYALQTPSDHHGHQHDDHHLEVKSHEEVKKEVIGSPVGPGPHSALAAASGDAAKTAGHGEEEHGAETHSIIGVALVLGFVFMLLVDQIGGNIHSSRSSTSDPSGSGRHKVTATIGLVVHAAADGIALGAAASTSHTDVEMIVFVAIMLHKAPAAFGLVSFLLHEGFERNRIRRHLAVFALSAPLLAIITYFGLSQRSKEALSDFNATGIAMLFSGGTFLYVATVHILPELAHMGGGTTSSSTTLGDTIITRDHHRGFSKLELVVMVVGCLLPLVLAVGHKH